MGLDYDRFVEQMRMIMKNPDPTKDCRTFKKWEKGALSTRGCWRSFLKNNGWVVSDWKYVKDDTMFEWYLNSMGYWRQVHDEEEEDEQVDVQ